MTTRVLNPMNRLCAALAATAFAAAACGDTYSLEGHVLATAAARSTAGPCYRLIATAGEPIAGYGAGGSYEIHSGFQAAGHDGALFFGSFEECAP